MPEPMLRGAPRRRIGAVLGLFMLLAVLYKLPVWLAPLSRYGGVSGQGDPVQTAWFLNWYGFALGHVRNPFVTDYINYPAGINLLWNTSVPALATVLWPVTRVWGAIASYNVITTLDIALASFFAFFAIRRWVSRDTAAFAGALLYGFSPFLVAQNLEHANVGASAAIIPIMLLLVDELIVRQRMRPMLLGLMLAGLGIVQFFVDEEFLVTDVLAGAVLVGVLALMHRDVALSRARYTLSALAVATPMLIAVLVFPVFALQLGGPDQVHGPIHDPNHYVTDLLDPVAPTSNQLVSSLVAGGASQIGVASERDAYIGVPVLVVIGAAMVRLRRGPVVRTAGVFAGVMTLLSFGPHLHVAGLDTRIPLPWWLPAHVPLLEDIQPNRLFVFASLAVAVLVAIALDRWWRARFGGIPVAAAIGIAMLATAPQVPQAWQPYPVASVVPSSVGAAGAVVVAISCPCPPAIDSLVWQIDSGMHFKLLGGYFLGPLSPGQGRLLAMMHSLEVQTSPGAPSEAQRAAVIGELRASHVSEVLLGMVPRRTDAVHYLDALLGTTPTQLGELLVWRVAA